MTPEMWAELRATIADQRVIVDEHAADLMGEGKTDLAQRAYGRVAAYDEVLADMDRMEQEADR